MRCNNDPEENVMLRRVLIAFLVLTLSIQSAAPALAWNDTGHMIVALIAYRRLSDSQKKQVAEILKAHPHYKLFLLDGKPADVDEGEWAFMKAATWPDFIRPYGGKPEEITKYHHGPWHYVDYPFVAPKDKDTITAPPFKPSDPNLVNVLPDCVAKLTRSDSSTEEKAVNLCWILHLVGDVHQPLHTISMYSEENKHGDMGGNALAIRSRGVPMNLHAYWDELLGTGTTYVAIDQMATTITASSVHDPDKMPELKKHPNLGTWATESHDLAVALTYLNGDLKTASWKSWENHQIQKDDIPELPPGYEANARELACRRVALAGYRLADLLEQTLK
jgi:S1/P1 Nuclease